MPLQRSLASLVCLLALAASSSAYTVRAGDTLSGIARRVGVSLSALADANGITDPNHVVEGRTLRLPGAAAAPEAAGAVHVVARGDTVSRIARRYGVSQAALVAANRLQSRHHIRIGDRLAVPTAAAPAATPASARGGSRSLPPRLRESPERLALIPEFRRWADANGIPADLLMAMTWLESGWQNHVVSSVGARGIGQLMPATVEFVRHQLIGVPTLDPGVPRDNIRMSARYLRWLLGRTDGDVRTALAGYYQGLRSVHVKGPYPSTVRYVDDVLSLRARFAG